MSIATVSILGTDYTVYEENTNKVFHDDGFDGFCRPYSKEIIVKSRESMLSEGSNYNNKEERYYEVLRHELVHAFCAESGVSYDNDEALVDWIARMLPKMNKAFDSILEQGTAASKEDSDKSIDIPEMENITNYKTPNIEKVKQTLEKINKEKYSCYKCKHFYTNKDADEIGPTCHNQNSSNYLIQKYGDDYCLDFVLGSMFGDYGD